MSSSRAIKRITFINQTLGLGGAEFLNNDILTWFQSQDITVDAWVNYPRFARLLETSGIFVRRLPIVLDIIGNWKGLAKAIILSPFGLVQYLYAVLLDRNTDCIIMSGFIEKIIVTPLANLFGISVVWWEYSSLQPVFNKFFGLPKLLYSFVARLPRAVIVPSENTYNALLKETNIPRNLLIVIPDGRHVDIPHPYPHTDNHLVVCVSRLEKGKGQDLLIRCFAQVVKTIPQAKLNIIGEGDFVADLKHLTGLLNLEKHINFIGWVPSAYIEMARAAIIVFPSVWDLEGFGLVSIEAMALGKPVVGFDCGPTPEIITRETGILVAKGDIKKLASAIIFLLKHPQTAKKMGKLGQSRFKLTYNIDITGPQYLNLLNSVMLE